MIYCEEEIDGYYIHRLELLSLENYRFTDPCKKCLVRPACTVSCEEHRKYNRFKLLKAEGWVFIKKPFKLLWSLTKTVLECLLGSCLLILFSVTLIFAMATCIQIFAIAYEIWVRVLS